MQVAFTKNELESVIFKATGVYPDALKLLDTLTPYCDKEDIKSAKILSLVGRNKEYRVNGVSFDGKQDILKQMQSGDVLYFVPEPTNPHDPNAIQVVYKEQAVGYLPRKQALLLQDCIGDLCGEVIKIVGEQEDDSDTSVTKSLGIRFVFRRKENITKKQVLNMDKVELILDNYVGTKKEIVATAQMFEILDAINKQGSSVLKDEPSHETPDVQKEIVSTTPIAESAPAEVEPTVVPAEEIAPVVTQSDPKPFEPEEEKVF